MMQPKLAKLSLALLFFCFSLTINAQVTTSTLSGVVKNETGKPMAGATVKISFSEAGINKSLVTKSDGSFTVPNLRVGGPYTVLVSFTGYAPKTESEVYL
ncbi:MAG: carboxypeptidase-like regulatory domain-containing protein, partial [Chitinophaga rupis]